MLIFLAILSVLGKFNIFTATFYFMPQTAIKEYFDSVTAHYKRGNATEHTYRGDLQKLIEAIIPTINATNEPKCISCGAPDYIITDKAEIPLGYIEAKDKYYAVNNGELIIALDEMNPKLVDKIIAAKPEKVITLDKLFTGNDQLKTNTVLQMRDAEIDFKTI